MVRAVGFMPPKPILQRENPAKRRFLQTSATFGAANVQLISAGHADSNYNATVNFNDADMWAPWVKREVKRYTDLIPDGHTVTFRERHNQPLQSELSKDGEVLRTLTRVQGKDGVDFFIGSARTFAIETNPDGLAPAREKARKEKVIAPTTINKSLWSRTRLGRYIALRLFPVHQASQPVDKKSSKKNP